MKLYRGIPIVQPCKENSWIVGRAFLTLSLKMHSFMPNKKIHPELNVCAMKSANDSMVYCSYSFRYGILMCLHVV